MDNVGMRLLVVLDESELGLHAAAFGAALAARLHADITLHLPIPIEHVEMRSAPGATAALNEHHKACNERAQKWFDRAREVLGSSVGEPRTLLTIDEEPCAAVLRVADEERCSLIVVATQERGKIARVLTDSLADDLVRQSPVPILVCREGMKHPWPPVGLPTP